MKATDFTLAWVQKFDFDGHPYKFSKVDLSLGGTIETSLFDRFSSYSSAQLNNVMIVLSDAIIGWKTNDCRYIFQEGEIVYLSTILNTINNTAFSLGFGFMRSQVAANIQSVGAVNYAFSRLAGTFYIFDFNDNPA